MFDDVIEEVNEHTYDEYDYDYDVSYAIIKNQPLSIIRGLIIFIFNKTY